MDRSSKVLYLVMMAPLTGIGRIAMALYFGISLSALSLGVAKVIGHSPQFMIGHSTWWPIIAALVTFLIAMYVRRLLRQIDHLADQIVAQ